MAKCRIIVLRKLPNLIFLFLGMKERTFRINSVDSMCFVCDVRNFGFRLICECQSVGFLFKFFVSNLGFLVLFDVLSCAADAPS